MSCKTILDEPWTRLEVLLGHLDDGEVGELGLDLLDLRADLLVALVLLDVHGGEGLALVPLVRQQVRDQVLLVLPLAVQDRVQGSVVRKAPETKDGMIDGIIMWNWMYRIEVLRSRESGSECLAEVHNKFSPTLTFFNISFHDVKRSNKSISHLDLIDLLAGNCLPCLLPPNADVGGNI